MFKPRVFWQGAADHPELYRPPGGAGRDKRRDRLMEATGHARPVLHGNNNG